MAFGVRDLEEERGVVFAQAQLLDRIAGVVPKELGFGRRRFRWRPRRSAHRSSQQARSDPSRRECRTALTGAGSARRTRPARDPPRRSPRSLRCPSTALDHAAIVAGDVLQDVVEAGRLGLLRGKEPERCAAAWRHLDAAARRHAARAASHSQSSAANPLSHSTGGSMGGGGSGSMSRYLRNLRYHPYRGDLHATDAGPRHAAGAGDASVAGSASGPARACVPPSRGFWVGSWAGVGSRKRTRITAAIGPRIEGARLPASSGVAESGPTPASLSTRGGRCCSRRRWRARALANPSQGSRGDHSASWSRLQQDACPPESRQFAVRGVPDCASTVCVLRIATSSSCCSLARGHYGVSFPAAIGAHDGWAVCSAGIESSPVGSSGPRQRGPART